MKWPTKKEREILETQGFIKEYKRLPHGRNFVVEEERDIPDRIVRDTKTNDIFGIELTSVYLDDRSVPDDHMREGDTFVPFSMSEIKVYERRILETIIDKVCKARRHYNYDHPLILSVYVNEYISLHMGMEYWKSFSSRYNLLFDCFAPFEEIVLWPLTSDDKDRPLVISAKMEKRNQ